MTDTERAKLRLECFMAVEKYSQKNLCVKFSDIKECAEDLFEWCVKEGGSVVKNMSFSITTPQMYREEKDVTRRWGWYDAKPGDQCRAVEKCMGLKKGEKLKEIYVIEIVSAKEEPLSVLTDGSKYGHVEMTREGFPGRDVHDFVAMLKKIKPKKCEREHPMRIEFKRVRL